MSFKETHPLEDDSLPGTSSATIKKLRDAGITTLEALVVTPPREVVDFTGMGLDTAEKAIETARSIVIPNFMTALDYDREEKTKPKLTTGSQKLDDLLGGGIETGAITEFYGEFGTGKSQICMMLTVNVQQPLEQGGLDGKAAVIDTENTFKTTRIREMAQALGHDADQVLDGILIAPAYNSAHQVTLIESLNNMIQEHNIKLVVVDSIIVHFRGEYLGRENLAPRQQKLNYCLNNLRRAAIANDVAIVVTNQLQSDPQPFRSDKAPGGHVMAHAATVRVRLRKGRDNLRIARVMDAPHLPEGEAPFYITERGVEDESG